MSIDGELDEWASGGHQAIRALVEDLGGDVAAFDRDPLSFQSDLDAFVAGQRPDDLHDDEWVWLHTQLAAYIAEVLIRTHSGYWVRSPASTQESGDVYVVAVQGDDGYTRHVDPFELVHKELRPVPQRVPRLIQQALEDAGIRTSRP